MIYIDKVLILKISEIFDYRPLAWLFQGVIGLKRWFFRVFSINKLYFWLFKQVFLLIFYPFALFVKFLLVAGFAYSTDLEILTMSRIWIKSIFLS